MKRKTPFFLLASVFLLMILFSCEKIPESARNRAVNEDPEDYTWDTTSVVQINLKGNSIEADESFAIVSGTKVTITSAGTYSINGSLSDGQLIVNTSDEGRVKLILNGVDLNCSYSSPILIQKAQKVIILLPDGVENIVSDRSSYATSSDEANAALFSKADLTIYGNGSLTVKGNYKDGISSKDGLLIKSGTLYVTASDDGIRGKDYVIIRDGNITINAGGDGLKSDYDTDNEWGYINIEKGVFNIVAAGDGIVAQTNLIISDGDFNITTGGGAGSKGTTEGPTPPGGGGHGSSGGYSGTVSAKALKTKINLTIEKGTFIINSADDALHSDDSVTINGGTFSITSGDDAIHATETILINEGNINILKSFEGLESASITVNKGTISMVSSDDGFNATRGLVPGGTESNDGSCLYINGGDIVVNSTSGDGMDSNGNVVMTGGTVIIHGPQSQPEVGFDINGTFTISGGLLLATGPNSGNMIETLSTSSEQNFVKIIISSTLSASSLLHIEDADGNYLVTYKPVRNIYYVVFSSRDLKSGSVYSIFTGGTSTGIYSDGLYTGGTYSGGILKKTFTVSGKSTSITF